MALAAPVNALTLPPNGALKFDVMRKGKDIGDHSFRFSGADLNFLAPAILSVTFGMMATETLRGSRLRRMMDQQ